MYTNRVLLRFILGVTFFLAMTTVAKAQSISGSIAFESAEGSEMGDSQWVGCNLLFKGKQHSCTVGNGLSSPLTGIARISGVVLDLKKLEDFPGVYKPAGADLSLGDGHLVLKNQKGVRLVLSAFAQLTELQAADSGIEFKLEEKGK